MKRSTENWITYMLVALFLAYVALRAWLLPITHDEGSTILLHAHRMAFDTLTFEKDANLNNHILNTLSIKLLLSIFPGHQFVARIPALIGGVLYVWAGLAICRRISTQPYVRVFGVLLLLGNPFLTEFFGLARGYGLATGLMLMALERSWRFFENHRPATLRAAFLFGGLAVYANFTLLLFFLPFSVLAFWATWQQSPSWTGFRAVVRPAFYTFIIYLLLWISPVTHLYKGDDFASWAILPSNLETIRLLIASSIRKAPYLGSATTEILTWATLLFIGLGIGIGSVQWRRQQGRFANDPKVFIAAVFAGIIITLLVQTNLLHTATLNARLALFLYPFFALLLASVADWTWTRWGRRSWIWISPVAALLVINNLHCVNLHDSLEWWFDSSTFSVLDKIQEIQTAEGRIEPYSFDSNWLFQNSFGVHVNEFHQGYDRVVRPVTWHPSRQPVAGVDFFFALEEGEVQALSNTYQMVYKPRIGYLLRKK